MAVVRSWHASAISGAVSVAVIVRRDQISGARSVAVIVRRACNERVTLRSHRSSIKSTSTCWSMHCRIVCPEAESGDPGRDGLAFGRPEWSAEVLSTTTAGCLDGVTTSSYHIPSLIFINSNPNPLHETSRARGTRKGSTQQRRAATTRGSGRLKAACPILSYEFQAGTNRPDPFKREPHGRPGRPSSRMRSETHPHSEPWQIHKMRGADRPSRRRCDHRRRPRRPPFLLVESWGMGVTSSMRPILMPARARARRADWAPGPGVLVREPPVARSLMWRALMPSSLQRAATS